MQDFNSLFASGRIAQDAALTNEEGKVPRINFCLVTNQGYIDRESGEWVDQVSFLDCVLFGPGATEARAEALKKGVRVVLQGRVVTNTWESAEGARRKGWSVQVSKVDAMGKPKQAEPFGAESPQGDLPVSYIPEFYEYDE